MAMGDSRIPKIVTCELVSQEINNMLPPKNWANCFLKFLRDSDLQEVAATPFDLVHTPKIMEYLDNIELIDFERSIRKIFDRTNGPFITSMYFPFTVNPYLTTSFSLHKRRFWLQLKLNKFKLSIGTTKIRLNQERCLFCEEDEPMTMYHLMVMCQRLSAPRTAVLSDIVQKINWNFNMSTFNLLFYSITDNEFDNLYEFFKIVLKEFV
jgi:hypothetical protein